jgi:hypothetical protein
LVAEEHYYSVSFTFDGTTFKRIVKITDAVELKKTRRNRRIESFSKFKIIQPYILKYHFPRKIKSVSNKSKSLAKTKITGITISFVRLSAKS